MVPWRTAARPSRGNTSLSLARRAEGVEMKLSARALLVAAGSASLLCATAAGARYTASIIAGGSVQNSVVPQPGSFTIDSLTAAGHFSDNNLAGVAIADFSGSALTGDFLNFKIFPSAQGNGFADVDLFVNN